MVVKQCIACNRKIACSKKICECGHVVERIKTIGGKRYSGYRAMWLSRGDTHKIPAPSSKKRVIIRSVKPAFKRLRNSPKTKREKGTIKTPSLKKHENFHRIMPSSSSQRERVPNKDEYRTDPELLENLRLALNDINNRIARQTLLWSWLKSTRC